jgi:hypothetical protein
MDCIECKRTEKAHDEILSDLQVLAAVCYSLEHNFIQQAKDEISILTRRLRERHLVLTERKI